MTAQPISTPLLRRFLTHGISRIFALVFVSTFTPAAYGQTSAATQTTTQLTRDQPTAPLAAANQFETTDDLQVELVLSEPTISQPEFMDFDERGRLWVVNYLQYPYPAGLKMVSRDKVWRAVYDKVPPAPPNHDKGADKITIHEDTNHDGVFDKHTVFLDGLNIVTSFARGRGGVWVLNPPYLLFYPDRNNDDIPDGDPEVHLEGFGIQDTHSCANSLRWGPDGWLYAGQGSTVTGNVKQPGQKEAVHSLGQLIWRYHPEKRIYEIFAEGGGNTFGVEFDAMGRVYSGHNGGDTRGFHFVQGGYYQKGFGKHGPLSNPFAFGYFSNMKSNKVARFVHNFVIYESNEFPSKYRGNLYGVEPMQGQVVRSEIKPDGTSFETLDIERVMSTDDVWFRPVDIKVGPDGFIYVADFYEPKISHRDHFAGNIDKERGRIYRLSPKNSVGTFSREAVSVFGRSRHTVFDLSSLNGKQLLSFLNHSNKWYRQTALRRLYDLADISLVPELRKRLLLPNSFATETLWAIHASGGFDVKTAKLAMNHDVANVRSWAIRLACDLLPFESEAGRTSRPIQSELYRELERLVQFEMNLHVRSQIICSIRRLPSHQAIPLLTKFIESGDAYGDADDIHLPLLTWWAMERQCTNQPQALLDALQTQHSIWKTKLFSQIITERLVRRFAQSGTRKDYRICEALFKLARDAETSKQMMRGFEQAFKGRPMTGLPTELNALLLKAGGDSITFRIRQGDKNAIQESLAVLRKNVQGDNRDLRLAVIEAFGEVDTGHGTALISPIVDQDSQIQLAALRSAQRYEHDAIGEAVVSILPRMNAENKEVALSLLASRKSWTRMLLSALEEKVLSPEEVSKEIAKKMLMHPSEKLRASIQKTWPDLGSVTPEKLQAEIVRVLKLIQTSDINTLDPWLGKTLFADRCGKCHQLFGQGGAIGPDLTTYNRQTIDNILSNIVNPSAEIREGFENYKVLTIDGRVVTGFIADQDNNVVIIRGADGQTTTIEKENIEDMAVQKTSLMPEGLLDGLTDRQVRDLFSFIQTSQPLNK